MANITLQPHVRNALKHIIKVSKDAISIKDYENVYKTEWDLYNGQFTPNLTEFLLSIGINPLLYMKCIPDRYACGLSITEVDIPDNIEEIGCDAFSHTNIASIKIPENIRFIGYKAFFNCKNLETVLFKGSTFSEAGRYIFKDCDNLKEIFTWDESFAQSLNDEDVREYLCIPQNTKITYLV